MVPHHPVAVDLPAGSARGLVNPVRQEVVMPTVAAAVDRTNAELWARFIDPRFHTFYDHAELDGTVHLPTAAELAEGRPNAFAWSLPNEDGAFFGGMYLLGLCRRWEQAPSDRTRQQALAIVDGLLRLSEVGQTPGFVARGVAADGVSHAICGSDDQTFPWFCGLHRLLETDLPDPALRERIAARLVAVVTAVHDLGWYFPSDRPGYGHRGSCRGLEPVAAPRLLFLCRALARLTGDRAWDQRYRAALHEGTDQQGRDRQAICRHGFDWGPVGTPPVYFHNPPFWTSASCVYAQARLAEWEDDPALRADYQAGLQAMARKAAPHIARCREHRSEVGVFSSDWRWLNQWWTPQPVEAATRPVAERQVNEWHRRNTRDAHEDSTLREPLHAAWIVALAGDDETWAAAAPFVREALLCFDPTKQVTSLCYMAVNAYHEALRRGLPAD
ncbi:MAG: hypothetical protein IT204_18905 [Fimbriimonadaceae bacterium]|nr:hypothetical protein [Fimbriimonadaceae bacterium]